MSSNKLWCFSLTNFGDALTPFIFERKGVPFDLVEDSRNANLFGIGSILRRVGARQQHTRVWTSGMISPDEGSDLVFNDTVEILALRGVMTKRRIKRPDVGMVPTGDGALLLRQVFDWRQVPKRHEVGIVAHINDRRNPMARQLANEAGGLYIDVLAPVEEVLTAIASCQRIVSSSLHGVIVADAFSIPNIAVRFADSKKGVDDSGKFVDYGTAIGRSVSLFTVELGATLRTLASLCESEKTDFDELCLDQTVQTLEETLLTLR